jgi:cytochrome c oxidase assembly protein subunit 15
MEGKFFWRGKILYNKALHWYAVFTSVCTFVLIIAGGLVTSTGSGLAVPDWPLSYGQIMPPMIGGIFYEHGHRMVATTVGFLTVILTVWIWRVEKRKWLRYFAAAAVATVLLQGALGGITVLFLLPTAISVSHATLAQTFFCIISSIAFFTSKWWTDFTVKYNTEAVSYKKTLTLCIIVTCAIYLQLILGATLRHTGSGLAVPDFPLAYGQLFPSLSPEALANYNKQLIYQDIRLAADGPITSMQIFIHMLHRAWALVVAIGIMFLSFRIRKKGIPILSRLSVWLVCLLLIQITLGAWSVLSRRAIEVATAHVATGALFLVCSVILTLSVAKYSGWFSHKSFQGQLAQEANA